MEKRNDGHPHHSVPHPATLARMSPVVERKIQELRLLNTPEAKRMLSEFGRRGAAVRAKNRAKAKAVAIQPLLWDR